MAPKIPPGPLTGKRPNGEQVFAEIKKNEREFVVVKAAIFNGYPMIHARIAFRKSNGEIHFTDQGFTVKPGEQAEALITAIAEAGRYFDDEGAAPVTSQSPVAPVAPAPSPSNGRAEPQSETARLLLKNNPRLTLEQINIDRVNRGLEPLT